ncbi:hypothetical protein EMCRGX_G033476 [Ephydatia muelleri]
MLCEDHYHLQLPSPSSDVPPVTMLALQLILPVVLLTFQSKPATGSANFSVVEKGTPPGAVVYNVTQACPELMNPQVVYDDTLTLTAFTTYFVIDKLVARVNSSVQLDRDQIAFLMGNTMLPVWYTVSVINPPRACLIRLHVIDLDDHTPTFPRSAVNLSIPEGPSSPASWLMDLATDVDEGVNSTQNYYISTSDPTVSSSFYLNMTRDSYGRIVLLKLVRNATISRRQTPSFSFVLVAEEGRPSAPKGYQSVFVNVEYVCSTPPVFSTPLYAIQVPEDTTVNSVVLTVKAIGQDVGTNGALNYSIASQCTFSAVGGACANGSSPFALDRASGNLTLIQMLNYGTVHQINLLIVATDSCNFVGSTQVQVMVGYVDKSPPVIQFFPQLSTIAIREDFTLPSDVATVTITSPVSFSVAVIDNTTGSVSDTFYLLSFGSSYRLRLQHPLDSKVRNNYNVTIKATDTRNNVAYSTVSINVLAVNHPPVFDNKTAFVSIFDNTANGTVILRVHASDSDLGGNGMVTYELPPPNATFPYQNNFTASSVNGDILTNGMLSRRVASSFLLLIKGRDNPTNGEPSLGDYMTVNVTLLGASINRPTFPPQPSQLNISENILVGSGVFQVVANANSTLITYGLALSSPVFQIDSVSGWIRVVSSLNNSATKRYVLNVTAYNGFPPPSTFILTIDILPGDAVGPVFVPRSYSALATRTAAVGSHIVHVKAVDVYSTALQYEIIDGNGEGKFAINTANGTISVLKQLDQSSQTYTLHVKASDPKFYSKWPAEVVITVQDLVFANAPYYFQVQEGVPAGTPVGSISVLLSSPGQLRFYIANGSDAFSIDPTSGVMTTRGPLVATNGSAYTVSVQAVFTPVAVGSQGLVATTALQDVRVFVVRRQSLYNVTVRGSLEVGTSVLNVSAADPPSTTYSLSSSNLVPFQVDVGTGSVYTTQYLDLTPKCTYSFGIVARYSSPSLSSAVQLFISVTIQLDLSILFDAASYDFSVLRTRTKGEVIGTIRATGRRNADIYYDFSKDDSKAYFQIKNTTGQISLLVDATQLPAGPLIADILAHDLLQDSLTPTLWSVVPVFITPVEPPSQSTHPDTQITYIAIIAAIIGGVLLLLVLVLIVALLTLRKKKHYNPKVSDGDGSHAPNNGCEMQTFGGGEGNGPASLTSIKLTESYPEPPTARRETEADSPNDESPAKDAPVYGTESLSRPAKHVRSTSDLASTVGTEMLSGLEDAGPYTKAQLMAIYAANAQLLQDDVSQDSVHMFGSEGGVEADDQEVDIDRMLFAKAIGFEEEDHHGCTSEAPGGGRDVAKDEQSVCSSGGLEPRTARDDREQPRYRFAAEKESWLPAVTSVTDTIDELVGEDPRFTNDRLSYPLSQALSLYSEGGSQSLLMRSQPAPHQYYGGGGGYMPRSLHESGYFNERDHPGQQAKASKHIPPPDHRYEAYPRANPGAYQPPRVHRYSSTTAIPHPHPLPNAPHSSGPQRKHPQQSNIRPPHTPSSNTPTDDGLMETIPSQRAPAYYSSISSLASTNLSQPCPRDRTLF